MEYIKICAMCSKEFITKRKNGKFCPDCREESAGWMKSEYNKRKKEELARKAMMKPKTLQDVALAATNAGMSYGQYMVKMRYFGEFEMSIHGGDANGQTQ